MNIPVVIKAIREKKGLSQSELAEISGLNPTYISLLESGIKESYQTKKLEKISGALGVPLPIISFLALKEEDIAVDKREAYSTLGPILKDLVEKFFIPD